MFKTHDFKVSRVTVTYTDHRSADEITAQVTHDGSMRIEYPESITIRETRMVRISRVNSIEARNNRRKMA